MSAQTITPEIREAIRTARAVEWQLEDEFHPFDWEERLALAQEMREVAAESDGHTRQLAEVVELQLESEAFDFSTWEQRLETANLTRAVIAGLQEMEGGQR
jgi:hypothetical protein